MGAKVLNIGGAKGGGANSQQAHAVVTLPVPSNQIKVTVIIIFPFNLVHL